MVILLQKAREILGKFQRCHFANPFEQESNDPFRRANITAERVSFVTYRQAHPSRAELSDAHYPSPTFVVSRSLR